MPIDKNLEFVAIDEIQMCSDFERGHIFTDRLLNLRGEKLTMLLGSSTMKKIISNLNADIEFINKERIKEPEEMFLSELWDDKHKISGQYDPMQISSMIIEGHKRIIDPI